jgi:AraC-like DNA-binding protein
MTTSPDVERLANLRAAKDLMDRSYAESLDLNAIAREAGYSRFHFVRSFRDTYGRTPRHYLSYRRVERARDLLRSANLTVTEVCYLVGFSSLGSFSARFKAEVGLSPSAYRDREVRLGGPPPIPGCFVLMWSTAPSAQSGRSGTRPSSVES